MAQPDRRGTYFVLSVVRARIYVLRQSLIACIETGEFMHVYNAIIVLKEILPVFPLAPIVPNMGARLDNAISSFVEKEERGDLKILGKASVL